MKVCYLPIKVGKGRSTLRSLEEQKSRISEGEESSRSSEGKILRWFLSPKEKM